MGYWCCWPRLLQRGCFFPVLLTLLSCLGFVILLPVPAHAQQNLVEAISIHGNRRIPPDTIRAHIFTRAGDVYDQAALERDFNSLWNTGYFDDLRIEREPGKKGWILHFYVKEKPTIRELNYVGLNSVSQSDVLDRFKERKVGLSVESQFDPTKVTKAAVVIKEMLAEHGRQFATVRTEVRPIPPAAVAVTFVVKEGPKVKVGKIRFEGNHKLKSRELRYAMKNLRPIGIPHVCSSITMRSTRGAAAPGETSWQSTRISRLSARPHTTCSTTSRPTAGTHVWPPRRPRADSRETDSPSGLRWSM